MIIEDLEDKDLDILRKFKMPENIHLDQTDNIPDVEKYDETAVKTSDEGEGKVFTPNQEIINSHIANSNEGNNSP